MRKSFYSKLAWTGIRKNKRLYTPFILTCIGTIMMYYIVSYMATLPATVPMKGGSTMQAVMELGKIVIAIFSVIFLFYTHSFLIRRRNREFGLYNVLGMDKRHIGRILFWETLIVTVLSLVFGIGLGIVFSKLAELALVKFLSGEITYTISIYTGGIRQTVVLFSAIFAVLLLISLGRVHLSKPLSLLRSETVGEKPPKANWFLALLGLVLLGGAYYLAISITEPITALMLFFVAVIMVIVATYFLFIAGSVTLCRLLQKRKQYYYQANHFISVSSMAYRMKRNGAGLASICVLMTMVLVMLSSTGSLFIGGEAALRENYPFDVTISVSYRHPGDLTPERREAHTRYIEEIIAGAQKDVTAYTIASTAGVLMDDHNFELDASAIDGFDVSTYETVRAVYFLPLEDYNQLTGKQVALEPDEMLVYGDGDTFPYDTVSFLNGKVYRIREVLQDFCTQAQDPQPISSFYFVVPDLNEVVYPMEDLRNSFGVRLVQTNFTYSCNMASGNPEDAIAISDRLFDQYHGIAEEGFGISCFAEMRDDYYALYGSLFFLGIVLSLVFLSATVLMIYYKQISEGFEDQARFDIMQKVGLTQKEIRKSINSQILTVFSVPLLLAGLHTAFAFPLIWRIIQFFGISNLKLLICGNVVCFLIFGLFYVIVYRITSNVYYSIVSGAKAQA